MVTGPYTRTPRGQRHKGSGPRPPAPRMDGRRRESEHTKHFRQRTNCKVEQKLNEAVVSDKQSCQETLKRMQKMEMGVGRDRSAVAENLSKVARHVSKVEACVEKAQRAVTQVEEMLQRSEVNGETRITFTAYPPGSKPPRDTHVGVSVTWEAEEPPCPRIRRVFVKGRGMARAFFGPPV